MSKQQSKSTLYIGGLDSQVTQEILHAAFLPFGEIIHIHIPVDLGTNEHRGFGFLEYEEIEDCQHAIDNMDGSELYGRVLRVNLARQEQIHKQDKYKPVWQKTDEYLKALQQDNTVKKMKDENERKKILQKSQQIAQRPAGPDLKLVQKMQ